jgi:hypothetical protein
MTQIVHAAWETDVRAQRRKLPAFKVVTVGGGVLRPRATSVDRVDFTVPASGRLIISWGEA